MGFKFGPQHALVNRMGRTPPSGARVGFGEPECEDCGTTARRQLAGGHCGDKVMMCCPGQFCHCICGNCESAPPVTTV